MANDSNISMDQLEAFYKRKKAEEEGQRNWDNFRKKNGTFDKGKQMVPTIEWIRKNFAIFNTKYFNSSIPTPRFSVNNCPPDLWACYDSATDTLSITQKYLRPEKSIKEALLHEMIHMYIIKVKGITPMFGGHGPMFIAKAALINADGWNVQAVTDMTEDDVLYKGERIPDEYETPQQRQEIAQEKSQQNQGQQVEQGDTPLTIQGMVQELQRISSEIQKLQQQLGASNLNESRRLIISEKQEKQLIKILKEAEENKKRSIDPQKVLLLKKKLDEKFIPLDYEMMKGGDAKCIKIAGRLTPKTKQVIEKLYEEDLDDWAADVCKDMFLSEKDCDDFAKLVVNRWLNNKISVHGMLDVNCF